MAPTEKQWCAIEQNLYTCTGVWQGECFRACIRPPRSKVKLTARVLMKTSKTFLPVINLIGVWRLTIYSNVSFAGRCLTQTSHLKQMFSPQMRQYQLHSCRCSWLLTDTYLFWCHEHYNYLSTWFYKVNRDTFAPVSWLKLTFRSLAHYSMSYMVDITKCLTISVALFGHQLVFAKNVPHILSVYRCS